MSNIYFTADLHLGHARILEYSNRRFANVDDMNETLVSNWNAKVTKNDRVYCLGDFALCSEAKAIAFARRLNGQKFLIFGNHDKRLRKSTEFLSQWIWARDIETIRVNDVSRASPSELRLFLCHYPMKTWDGAHRGTIQLHGHSHGSLKYDPGSLQVDVGVDCWDLAPCSLEQINARLSDRKFVPIDHHGDRPWERDSE